MATRRPRRRGIVALGATLGITAGGLFGTANHDAPPPADAPAPATTVRLAEPTAPKPHIVVSIDQRRLWLIQGSDTLLAAPVAVGKGQSFTYRGKTYHFRTPRGQRRVLAKETDPVWVPPEWHYYEKAARRKLEPVLLQPGERYPLDDGTVIEVRDGQVGRVNKFGNFWPFTPGTEIIFYGKIFIPPIGTPQREVPNALGTHKLDLGDGYLIHGTHRYNEDSIGQAVSHGCIRMRNQDIARLYELVDVGTLVYIR
jgi:lipoprotein-anchoring transpeptidase ErfK/SrfK